jgi:hypothetical protein
MQVFEETYVQRKRVSGFACINILSHLKGLLPHAGEYKNHRVSLIAIVDSIRLSYIEHGCCNDINLL